MGVFLLAFFIDAYEGEMLVRDPVLSPPTTQLVQQAKVLCHCFHKIMEATNQENGFAKVSVELTASFLVFLFTFENAYMAWRDYDLPRVIRRIKDALQIMYMYVLDGDAHIEDVQQLHTNIVSLRKKLVKFDPSQTTFCMEVCFFFRKLSIATYDTYLLFFSGGNDAYQAGSGAIALSHADIYQGPETHPFSPEHEEDEASQEQACYL